MSTAGLIQAGGLVAAPEQEREGMSGLIGGAAEPEEKESEVAEAPAAAASQAAAPAKGSQDVASAKSVDKKPAEPAGDAQPRQPVPLWLWITFGIGAAVIAVTYALWN